jgi:RHS repeat-associated protein
MFHLDLNVLSDTSYYYKVVTVGATGNSAAVSGESNIIEAVRLPRATGVPSPPRHLKAWGPLVVDAQNNFVPGRNVYLKWCPNPTQENVTAYRIYRSRTQGGPYYQIVEIDNATTTATDRENNCMMGSRKCTIECQSGGCPEPTSWQPGQTLNTKAIQKSASCTTGRMGTCRIIDTTVVHPSLGAQGSGADAQDNLHYYYVVTAVAGGIESAYSNENVALPNYCGAGTSCGSYLRYDPDNEGDVSCDDENSELIDLEGEPTEALASLDEPAAATGNTDVAGLPARIPSTGMLTESEPANSPYRLIGARYASVGGAEGTTPGQGGSFTPPPVVPKWLFYHTDHLGNSRVIMDINGQVVSKHDFMPFGEERPIPPLRTSSNTNYFTGHERDRESAPSDDVAGLDYMMARYYSSSLGRFMAVDPGDDTDLEDPQSWNKYSYVRNNPLKFIDTDGQEVTYATSPEVQHQASLVSGIGSQSPTFAAEIAAHSGVDPDLNFGNPEHLTVTEKGIADSRVDPETLEYEYTNIEIDNSKHWGDGDLKKTIIEEVAHANAARTNPAGAYGDRTSQKKTEQAARAFIRTVNKEIRQYNREQRKQERQVRREQKQQEKAQRKK